MLKWIFRVIALLVMLSIGFWFYDANRAGLFDLPVLPDGAYTLSFESGFRAIILDADVPDESKFNGPRYFRSLRAVRTDRRFFGLPLDVQPWFRDAWSWCKTPTGDEQAELDRMPDEFRKSVENARFEAVCRIDVDGKEIVRGLIFSVPRL